MVPRPQEQFGKFRESTARIIYEAKDIPAWTRFMFWMIPRIRGGENLPPIERAWASSWLADNYPGLDVDDIQTVQFSIKEASDELFNGNHGGYHNAVKGIIKTGMIAKIHDGIRGHGTLYAIMPLPDSEVNTCFNPIEPDKVQTYFNPNDVVENSLSSDFTQDALTQADSNGVKQTPERGLNEPPKGLKPEPLTCDDIFYPELPRITQKEPCGAVADKPAPPDSRKGETAMARLGEQCPDPKEQGCRGTICMLKDVTGNPKPKHPDWMMCDRCNARFDAKGEFQPPIGWQTN